MSVTELRGEKSAGVKVPPLTSSPYLRHFILHHRHQGIVHLAGSRMPVPTGREWVPRRQRGRSVSILGPGSPGSGGPRTLTSLSYQTWESRWSSTRRGKTTWGGAGHSGRGAPSQDSESWAEAGESLILTLWLDFNLRGNILRCQQRKRKHCGSRNGSEGPVSRERPLAF